MIDERDVWRTAKLLIDQHGVEAPLHAAMRVDEMLDAGDILCNSSVIVHRYLRNIREYGPSRDAKNERVKL